MNKEKGRETYRVFYFDILLPLLCEIQLALKQIANRHGIYYYTAVGTVPERERILIMQSAPIRSFEYKNAFLYVVIREEPRLGPDSYIYCSGINLSRFCRLSWRKGGICSNPAVRGIQLLRHHVSAFAAKQGMIATKTKEIAFPITPHGEGWYHEHPLRLKKATPKKILELLKFSVMDLVKTVLVVCVPDAKLPTVFPDAVKMQKYLESLSIAEERERVMAYERENLR
jgi:hypothetical protein